MILFQNTDRWKSQRLGQLFYEQKSRNSDLSRTNALKFTYGTIVRKPQYKQTPSLMETYAKYTLTDIGDIVVNCLNLNYDFVSQRIAIVPENGIITSAYIVLRSRNENINQNFYCYYFKAMDSRKMFHGMGTGIRLTLSYKELRNVLLPVPPRDEQEQIVRFLDWKVSIINKLISIKKKQLSDYRELRKAVIDQGVLYGFKNTERKNSGVYWLGEVPATWEILPLKRICRANASISDIVKKKNESELVTFLPMENVSQTGAIDCSVKKKISDVRTGFSSFAKEDVVVAKITPCFENGKGACLEKLDTEIGFGTTEFINLRPSEKVLSKYLYMITMARPFRKLGEEVMTGSAGQKRIPVNYIKNFTLGIPDIEEQESILEEIDRRLAQIDKAIEIECEEIKSLQILKSRIIADTVTGKIDVRGIEIPDYEFIEENFDADSEDGDVNEDSVEQEN